MRNIVYIMLLCEDNLVDWVAKQPSYDFAPKNER